jgi:hypothetical protein
MAAAVKQAVSRRRMECGECKREEPGGRSSGRVASQECRIYKAKLACEKGLQYDVFKLMVATRCMKY